MPKHLIRNANISLIGTVENIWILGKIKRDCNFDAIIATRSFKSVRQLSTTDTTGASQSFFRVNQSKALCRKNGTSPLSIRRHVLLLLNAPRSRINCAHGNFNGPDDLPPFERLAIPDNGNVWNVQSFLSPRGNFE